jgi:hypothetical protein
MCETRDITCRDLVYIRNTNEREGVNPGIFYSFSVRHSLSSIRLKPSGFTWCGPPAAAAAIIWCGVRC